MTITYQSVEIPRDRYGRPMVLAPGSKTKRVGYRRTTTFADVLENQKGLEGWSMRCTAFGLSQRPDLVLGAAALDPKLAISGEHPQKKKLNQIAEQAKEFARASAAATTGTALHAFTEQIDRGQPLTYIPAEYEADIHAYQKATQSIEFTAIETFRVYDQWQVAGTADRIGRDKRGRLRIYDIKTGSIDYPHKMAIQLAMYAHSLPYDIGTDTRGNPEDGLDLHRGVIIHLPAGAGRCDLYEIDIALGWAACRIAKQVWDWRATKNLTQLYDPDVEPPQMPTWESLTAAATNLDELRLIWKRAHECGQLTETLRALCTERSTALQNTK